MALVGCLAAFGVAGCGSKSSSSSPAAVAPAASGSSSSGGSSSAGTTSTPTTHFAKTKFVFHFGLAGGAFHRYIYKPFKAGVFGRPSTHKVALVKAAVAALFVYHEIKLAARDVRSSKILSTLFAPLTFLANKFSALRAQFLGGRYNPADINAAEAAGGSIGRTASAAGYPVADQLPTGQQLAAGVAQ